LRGNLRVSELFGLDVGQLLHEPRKNAQPQAAQRPAKGLDDRLAVRWIGEIGHWTRSQKSEVRSQKSEVRSQKSDGVGCCHCDNPRTKAARTCHDEAMSSRRPNV